MATRRASPLVATSRAVSGPHPRDAASHQANTAGWEVTSPSRGAGIRVPLVAQTQQAQTRDAFSEDTESAHLRPTPPTSEPNAAGRAMPAGDVMDGSGGHRASGWWGGSVDPRTTGPPASRSRSAALKRATPAGVSGLAAGAALLGVKPRMSPDLAGASPKGCLRPHFHSPRRPRVAGLSDDPVEPTPPGTSTKCR